MSELDDVKTTVGVIDGLRGRIAELEAENEYVHQLEEWLAQVRERSEKLLNERNDLRAELAALKAENEVLRNRLQDYQLKNPKSHGGGIR